MNKISHFVSKDIGSSIRYFYIKNNITLFSGDIHPHHMHYNKVSQNDGIMHSAVAISKPWTKWIIDWLNIAESNPQMILLVKYEDLNRDPQTTFQIILNFFEFSKGIDLKKEPPLKTTKRKGQVGDWKNYFTDEHKLVFKGNEALRRLGYER